METRSCLPHDMFGGSIDARGLSGNILSLVFEIMTQSLRRSRQLLAASILPLLLAVVALSSATRQPCLQPCSGGWHTFKAGYMTESHGQDVCAPKAIAERETALAVPLAPASTPSRRLREEDQVFPRLSRDFQVPSFRSPPVLG